MAMEMGASPEDDAYGCSLHPKAMPSWDEPADRSPSPHNLLEFIDQVVERGQASSRAAVVARAVDRERRREIAERDAAILAHAGPDPEFDQLAEFAAATPLPDLD